jgi:hypothetical protein
MLRCVSQQAYADSEMLEQCYIVHTVVARLCCCRFRWYVSFHELMAVERQQKTKAFALFLQLQNACLYLN